MKRRSFLQSAALAVASSDLSRAAEAAYPPAETPPLSRVAIFPSAAGMQSLMIPDGLAVLWTAGHYEEGDGGAAFYRRADAQIANAYPPQARFTTNHGSVIWVLAERDLCIEQFGARGDSATDNTASIQAALDFAAKISSGTTGARLSAGAGTFLCGGIYLRSRVHLQGSGLAATILRLLPSTDADLLTIPADCALAGWSGITLDGNAGHNSRGSGIVFERTSPTDGDSFMAFNQRADRPAYSYKDVFAHDFVVGNCATDGIKVHPSNYSVRLSRFNISHCRRDGLAVSGSDGIYDNFYSQRNGRCGLYGGGSSNKFSSFKSIWNGGSDKSYGGWRDQSSRNIYICGEAQDNYCDGLQILGDHPTFIGCSSNTNGYLAPEKETFSDGKSANIVGGGSAKGVHFTGQSYSYRKNKNPPPPLGDARWTTQFPYRWDKFDRTKSVSLWHVDFDPETFNAGPNMVVDPPSPMLRATKPFSLPDLSGGQGTVTTLTVAGAFPGDIVQAAYSAAGAAVTVTALVSEPNIVTVKIRNDEELPLSASTGMLNCLVFK